jgi:uncharacterized phage protein gp47/JayE
MATQADVASRIVATLAITEPDLDTAVGSVTRKIVDAVAQQMADSYVDNHLLTYQYDIDSKIEADLDDFVQNFGISRIAAKRATGVVVFQRGTGDMSTSVRIPVNTQIASTQIGTSGVVTLVQTVTPGFMGEGVATLEVPVQAVEPGVVGNIGAGLLTRFRSPVEGVTAVTNVTALSGGTGQETDSELRARWKRTVFRSLAGVEAMYLGIAINNENCFGANVLGATKTHFEQIQIQPLAGTKGVGYSSLTEVAYAYGDTAVMGPHLAGSQVLLRGRDFELDTSVRPPLVIMLVDNYATGNLLPDGVTQETLPVVGDVFDLTFEYAPQDSRNLPAQGITNRVDIWCAGVNAQTATQAVIFSTNRRFVPDYGSPYWVYNFIREDHQAPHVNNVFIPLAFGPIITIPPTLVVGSTTYQRNVHYWLVHDDTAFGYAATSRFGLEWDAASLPVGLVDPVFIVGENDTYVYNKMIEDIQAGIDRWRLTSIDAVAHQAKLQYLRFNIAVMYDRNANADITNSQITVALQTYLQGLSFGATVQVSDVLQAIHGAPGVDNVRFLDRRDWPTYGDTSDPNTFGVGIQRVVIDSSGAARVVESYVQGPNAEAFDILFGDSEVPVFESIRGDRIDPQTGAQFSGRPAVRAQNTFAGPIPAATTPPPGGGGGSGFTLSGTQVDHGSYADLSLSWTAYSGALGYSLYRDSEPNPIASFGPANGTPVSTSFSGSALPGPHTYVIRAYTSFTTGANTATYVAATNALAVGGP